jgi:hypothetical protein
VRLGGGVVQRSFHQSSVQQSVEFKLIERRRFYGLLQQRDVEQWLVEFKFIERFKCRLLLRHRNHNRVDYERPSTGGLPHRGAPRRTS